MTICVLNYLLYDKINQGKNEFSAIYSAAFNCRFTACWRQLFNQLSNRVISLYIYTVKTHICTRYLARCVININTSHQVTRTSPGLGRRRWTAWAVPPPPGPSTQRWSKSPWTRSGSRRKARSLSAQERRERNPLWVVSPGVTTSPLHPDSLAAISPTKQDWKDWIHWISSVFLF